MGMTLAVRKGGAGAARLLLRLLFLLVVAAGLWLLVQGAWIPAKAWAAQRLLERAYAAAAHNGQPARPWPWADAAPVARIAVSRLAVEQIVLSGGSGEAMAFGPTLMPGASAPGERGTAVVAAHRDTHFRFLQDVRTGDIVEVEQPGRPSLRYRVTGARIVRRDRYALPTGGAASRLALVTCWPFGASQRGPLRYVVEAELER